MYLFIYLAYLTILICICCDLYIHPSRQKLNKPETMAYLVLIHTGSNMSRGCLLIFRSFS